MKKRGKDYQVRQMLIRACIRHTGVAALVGSLGAFEQSFNFFVFLLLFQLAIHISPYIHLSGFKAWYLTTLPTLGYTTMFLIACPAHRLDSELAIVLINVFLFNALSWFFAFRKNYDRDASIIEIPERKTIVLEYVPHARLGDHTGYWQAYVNGTTYGTRACVTRDEALKQLMDDLKRAQKPWRLAEYDLDLRYPEPDEPVP